MAEIGVASVFGFENTAVTGLDENPFLISYFQGLQRETRPPRICLFGRITRLVSR